VIAPIEDPDSAVPESARAVLNVLIGTFQALEAQIQALDAEITQRAKADPVARRLMTIPGIGPIAATAITALVPAPEGFRAGRDFAAWLGLTPLQKSTGGKQKGTVNLIGSGRDKAGEGRSHEHLCPSGNAGDLGPSLEGLGSGSLAAR